MQSWIGGETASPDRRAQAGAEKIGETSAQLR
jgi:hypothetical protein